MTTPPAEEWLTRFRQAAQAHTLATDSGNFKAGYQAREEIMKALQGLRDHYATELLRGLLTSPEAGSRIWAATYLLAVSNDAEAEATLQQQAVTDDLNGITAQITLREWRAGKLTWQ